MLNKFPKHGVELSVKSISKDERISIDSRILRPRIITNEKEEEEEAQINRLHYPLQIHSTISSSERIKTKRAGDFPFSLPRTTHTHSYRRASQSPWRVRVGGWSGGGGASCTRLHSIVSFASSLRCRKLPRAGSSIKFIGLRASLARVYTHTYSKFGMKGIRLARATTRRPSPGRSGA